jgi:hypothetical protein
MDIAKVVRRRVREAMEQAERTGDRDDVHRDDVNIVSAVNIAQSDTTTAASTKQDVEIVQNGRRTRITDHTP